jgi:predicted AAA+ superfamily ATPase
MAVDSYRPRLVDDVLDDAMAGFAAVMVVGPRAVGKTTTAARRAQQVDRLDLPDTAALYRADPDAALRRAARPLLIDEWQEVPDVLGAVKRSVDSDPTPGQFILTGSVRVDTDLSTWAGTGRVIRVPMHPLTEAEVNGRQGPGLVHRLTTTWLDLATPPAAGIDECIDRAFRSGFPDLAYATRTARQRSMWLSSYLGDLVSRDVSSIGAPRDPERLRRYVEVLALNLAGQPSDQALLRDADLNARTAAAYERALTTLGVIDLVPAWVTNRLKRITKGTKRYFTDTGLAAAAAGVTPSDVLGSSDLLGRWFDAFATMQVRAEAAAAFPSPRLHHLRVESGRHEVDLVLDLGNGKVFGFEFKAGAAPTLDDAKHLVWLRDEYGKRFVGGVVVHTGQVVIELADRIGAVPISASWK